MVPRNQFSSVSDIIRKYPIKQHYREVRQADRSEPVPIYVIDTRISVNRYKKTYLNEYC